MSDAADPVADAKAELDKAEADLAAAEAMVSEGGPAPEEHPDAHLSDAELIAKAPPLVLPEGTYLEKTCPGCGLRFDGEVPADMPCPNCKTPVP